MFGDWSGLVLLFLLIGLPVLFGILGALALRPWHKPTEEEFDRLDRLERRGGYWSVGPRGLPRWIPPRDKA